MSKLSRTKERIAVSVKHVQKVYEVRKNPFRKPTRVVAVKHINLEVYEGEILGIVGESGSGKSTLARLIAGIEEPTTGSIKTEKPVQVVFQDPYSSLNPRMKVVDIVTEPLEAKGKLSKKEKLEIAKNLLSTMGLPEESLYKYPHEFSGGQRQRIAIARAISINPKVLILDEPTSSLDVFVQAQIIELLISLHQKTKATYLFITHNIPLISGFANRVIVMKGGEVVEEGVPEEILQHPRHPYTQKLVNSIPSKILSLISA